MFGRVVVLTQVVCLTCAFMCSSLNIGTDVKNTKDIVNAGVLQRMV